MGYSVMHKTQPQHVNNCELPSYYSCPTNEPLTVRLDRRWCRVVGRGRRRGERCAGSRRGRPPGCAPAPGPSSTASFPPSPPLHTWGCPHCLPPEPGNNIGSEHDCKNGHFCSSLKFMLLVRSLLHEFKTSLNILPLFEIPNHVCIQWQMCECFNLK